jgi:hypothetical protein
LTSDQALEDLSRQSSSTRLADGFWAEGSGEDVRALIGKLESFPTVSESTFGQFICALRRIASFTLSGARFLLVLVLLSAVRYLPLPIFTALNEIPGGLSCTVVQASTVRLTKSVGPILSFLSHDLVSEPWVRLVPTYFLAPKSRQTHFSFTLCDCDFRIRTDERPALALMPNLPLREISKRLYHLSLHILKF